MTRVRFLAVFIILAGIAIGYFNYSSEINPESLFRGFAIKLGLDLQGGSHLIYKADTSELEPSEVADAMDALRDIIERRTNLFGVSEPLVQVERKGFFKTEGEKEYRLIVELPGVTDLEQAVKIIGDTPLLEFMVERPDGPRRDEIIAFRESLQAIVEAGEEPSLEVLSNPLLLEHPNYMPTELTGAYLARASLGFDQTLFEPKINLEFNKEGEKLFAEITRNNVGKTVAIFLDRPLGNLQPITAPVVREEIKSGTAEISGSFTSEEAKILVGRLNSGVLPIPIELIGEQGIGATLGADTLNKGVNAGLYGILVVMIFMVLWYRLPGLISVIALALYLVLVLFIFKIIGVTLTAAGIAGFILSIGMAVDANVLIFERIKEELKSGKKVSGAITDGFKRAWLSIRDANISSLITAVILFWFGTSLVKGFALTFGIGILISMFSAITITRTLLIALGIKEESRVARFLLKSGLEIRS